MTMLAQEVRRARAAKGWTQAQLAEATGLSQPAIVAIENGDQASTKRWTAMADALGIPRDEFAMLMARAKRQNEFHKRQEKLAETASQLIRPELLSSGSDLFAPSIRQSPPASNAQIGEGLDPVPGEQIPVYGRAQGGPDGKFEFNGEVMGWEQRPPNLRGVRGVYAVYIDGESMYPRYKPGETVVAHPGRPIAKGDDVVVQVAPEEEGEAPLGYVKELVSLNSKELIVKQFNPDIEIRFPRERVISVHRIVSADR